MTRGELVIALALLRCVRVDDREDEMLGETYEAILSDAAFDPVVEALRMAGYFGGFGRDFDLAAIDRAIAEAER